MGLLETAWIKIRDLYFGVEEKYYQLMEGIQEKLHLPTIDWFVNPIESKGIPSMPILFFIAASIVIVTGILMLGQGGVQDIRIVALAGGQLIPGVQVELLNERDEVLRATSTDGKGTASFQGVAEGNYKLRVTDQGKAKTEEINLKEQQHKTIRLDDIHVFNKTIYFEVRDLITEDPISNAALTVSLNDVTENIITNEDGIAEYLVFLKSKEEVKTFVRVSSEGYYGQDSRQIITLKGKGKLSFRLVQVSDKPSATAESCLDCLKLSENECAMQICNERSSENLIVSIRDKQTQEGVDATLEVFSEGLLLKSIPANYGSATISGLPLSTSLKIRARSPGYLASEIDVHGIENSGNILIELDKATSENAQSVIVKTVDEIGSEIPATVWIYQLPNNLIQTGEAGYASSGVQVVNIDKRLAADELMAAAVADGRIASNAPFIRTAAGSAEATAVLEKATLENSGSLEVTITDEDGILLSSGNVKLLHPDGQFLLPTKEVDELTGSAKFENLRLGSEILIKASSNDKRAERLIILDSNQKKVIIPLELNYATVKVTAKDVLTGEQIPNPTITSFFNQREYDKCSGSQCTLKVKVADNAQLVASATGYIPTTKAIGRQSQGVETRVDILMLPESARNQTIFSFQGFSEGSNKVEKVAPGKKYRANFFFSSTKPKTSIYIRLGEEKELKDIIKTIPAISGAKKTAGTTYAPSEVCSDAASDEAGKGLKWVELTLEDPQQASAELYFEIIPNPRAANGAMSLHYRSHYNENGLFLRTPEDPSLGTNENSQTKSGCYAKANSTSIIYELRPNRKCEENACIEFEVTQGGTYKENILVGKPASVAFKITPLRAIFTPELTLTSNSQPGSSRIINYGCGVVSEKSDSNQVIISSGFINEDPATGDISCNSDINFTTKELHSFNQLFKGFLSTQGASTLTGALTANEVKVLENAIRIQTFECANPNLKPCFDGTCQTSCQNYCETILGKQYNKERGSCECKGVEQNANLAAACTSSLGKWDSVRDARNCPTSYSCSCPTGSTDLTGKCQVPSCEVGTKESKANCELKGGTWTFEKLDEQKKCGSNGNCQCPLNFEWNEDRKTCAATSTCTPTPTTRCIVNPDNVDEVISVSCGKAGEICCDSDKCATGNCVKNNAKLGITFSPISDKKIKTFGACAFPIICGGSKCASGEVCSYTEGKFSCVKQSDAKPQELAICNSAAANCINGPIEDIKSKVCIVSEKRNGNLLQASPECISCDSDPSLCPGFKISTPTVSLDGSPSPNDGAAGKIPQAEKISEFTGTPGILIKFDKTANKFKVVNLYTNEELKEIVLQVDPILPADAVVIKLDDSIKDRCPLASTSFTTGVEIKIRPKAGKATTSCYNKGGVVQPVSFLPQNERVLYYNALEQGCPEEQAKGDDIAGDSADLIFQCIGTGSAIVDQIGVSLVVKPAQEAGFKSLRLGPQMDKSQGKAAKLIYLTNYRQLLKERGSNGRTITAIASGGGDDGREIKYNLDRAENNGIKLIAWNGGRDSKGTLKFSERLEKFGDVDLASGFNAANFAEFLFPGFGTISTKTAECKQGSNAGENFLCCSDAFCNSKGVSQQVTLFKEWAQKIAAATVFRRHGFESGQPLAILNKIDPATFPPEFQVSTLTQEIANTAASLKDFGKKDLADSAAEKFCTAAGPKIKILTIKANNERGTATYGANGFCEKAEPNKPECKSVSTWGEGWKDAPKVAPNAIGYAYDIAKLYLDDYVYKSTTNCPANFTDSSTYLKKVADQLKKDFEEIQAAKTDKKACKQIDAGNAQKTVTAIKATLESSQTTTKPAEITPSTEGIDTIALAIEAAKTIQTELLKGKQDGDKLLFGLDTNCNPIGKTLDVNVTLIQEKLTDLDNGMQAANLKSGTGIDLGLQTTEANKPSTLLCDYLYGKGSCIYQSNVSNMITNDFRDVIPLEIKVCSYWPNTWISKAIGKAAVEAQAEAMKTALNAPIVDLAEFPGFEVIPTDATPEQKARLIEEYINRTIRDPARFSIFEGGTGVNPAFKLPLFAFKANVSIANASSETAVVKMWQAVANIGSSQTPQLFGFQTGGSAPKDFNIFDNPLVDCLIQPTGEVNIRSLIENQGKDPKYLEKKVTDIGFLQREGTALAPIIDAKASKPGQTAKDILNRYLGTSSIIILCGTETCKDAGSAIGEGAIGLVNKDAAAALEQSKSLTTSNDKDKELYNFCYSRITEADDNTIATKCNKLWQSARQDMLDSTRILLSSTRDGGVKIVIHLGVNRFGDPHGSLAGFWQSLVQKATAGQGLAGLGMLMQFAGSDLSFDLSGDPTLEELQQDATNRYKQLFDAVKTPCSTTGLRDDKLCVCSTITDKNNNIVKNSDCKPCETSQTDTNSCVCNGKISTRKDCNQARSTAESTSAIETARTGASPATTAALQMPECSKDGRTKNSLPCKCRDFVCQKDMPYCTLGTGQGECLNNPLPIESSSLPNCPIGFSTNDNSIKIQIDNNNKIIQTIPCNCYTDKQIIPDVCRQDTSACFNGLCKTVTCTPQTPTETTEDGRTVGICKLG